jgi:hypothetical protein
MSFPRLRITLAALAISALTFSAPAEAHNRTNFVDAAAIPAYPTSNYVRVPRGRPHAARQARTHRAATVRRHHEARQASHAVRRSPVRYSRSAHRQVAYRGEGVIGGRPSGCPHAYCGCEASRYIFGRIIADLNLAANWFRFPRAAPAPGMAAVRRHHVFVILSVNGDGTVMAHDGNSGHGLTREHVVSLRGYTVVNPHGRRYASR